MAVFPPLPTAPRSDLLRRLARNEAGNVIAIIAASIFPLLALIGGGIDMGRGYLSQSRLQQACDAGVLAARKRLGTQVAAGAEITQDVADTGQRFFNINFGEGDYGTRNRAFQMTLESDFSISGEASVDVPTTIMAVFGFTEMDVSVDCTAQINMANTDIMMVLDTTGSMAETNSGDTLSKIEALRSTVSSFYDQMAAAARGTSRIRYGFVPYSTNVNVGHLLADDWVVDDWDYQSRRSIVTGTKKGTRTYNRNWTTISGSAGSETVISTYPATYHEAQPGTQVVDDNENVTTVGASGAYWSCDTAAPAGNVSTTSEMLSSEENNFEGPPRGKQTVELWQRVQDGTGYRVTRSGETCQVRQRVYDRFTQQYERVTEPTENDITKWQYRQLTYDVSDWRSSGNGCIEERATYPIDDFDNVDLSRALDLDIDLVPTSDDDTRWRPSMPQYLYARSMKYDNTGSFTPASVTTNDNYIAPAVLGLAQCPSPAMRLSEITSGQLDTFLSGLTASGSTYHDIGMIWGGRLLSPTGLFAADNRDVSAAQPTNRHMIFLTDGETAPLDLAYASYGLEPLDRRRWSPSSALSLVQTVENRFSFACEEVKKKNITVWVISFGTAPNAIMQTCAGPDHYFVADDAAELESVFTAIANRMAELRVTR
ncbi:TadE/TadG family type IV pilus assembly protein [Aurantiacibacter spongiae]|uniref:VWFA domain-containing protein n=1 Tax=Aurantiacibacter spongiae TaxID=2488860 RepID=A0A3N5CP32_9SPHN|nr:TadE/TadG family type IV pilus assembly protein [Aurantiacibacter spongiae]RPF70337.1 hypothetical protein EG799_00840 [Aurantiacibacter spongiae]